MNDTKQDIAKAWKQLEVSLVYARQHIHDGQEVGNMLERIPEISRHLKEAKESFDWLDNFATVKASD